jgi:hypothetical protein
MWQCVECGQKVEDDTQVCCSCGTPRGWRREIRLDEQPKGTFKEGTARVKETQPRGSLKEEQPKPQENASSMDRAIMLVLIALICPSLGVAMAGLELGYRNYRFGVILLSLTFVQLVLYLLFSLLSG